MIQIFTLMAFLGGFSFIGFGLCVANSNLSKISSNIMTGFSVIGMVSFLIGIIGLIVMNLF